VCLRPRGWTRTRRSGRGRCQAVLELGPRALLDRADEKKTGRHRPPTTLSVNCTPEPAGQRAHDDVAHRVLTVGAGLLTSASRLAGERLAQRHPQRHRVDVGAGGAQAVEHYVACASPRHHSTSGPSSAWRSTRTVGRGGEPAHAPWPAASSSLGSRRGPHRQQRLGHLPRSMSSGGRPAETVSPVSPSPAGDRCDVPRTARSMGRSVVPSGEKTYLTDPLVPCRDRGARATRRRARRRVLPSRGRACRRRSGRWDNRPRYGATLVRTISPSRDVCGAPLTRRSSRTATWWPGDPARSGTGTRRTELEELGQASPVEAHTGITG